MTEVVLRYAVWDKVSNQVLRRYPTEDGYGDWAFADSIADFPEFEAYRILLFETEGAARRVESELIPVFESGGSATDFCVIPLREIRDRRWASVIRLYGAPELPS